MRLPEIKSAASPVRREIVQSRGLNFSDDTADGDLASCLNLGWHRWPFLAARRAREAVEGYDDIKVTDMCSWDGLVCVTDEGKVLYDGDEVGTVTPGVKQFAAVNTKLVIWPDGVYLDRAERDQLPVIKPMGAKVKMTKAVFTATSVQLVGVTDAETGEAVTDLGTVFAKGDGLEIARLKTLTANNISVVITGVSEDTLFVVHQMADESFETIFTAGTEEAEEGKTFTVTREIPPFDFICESGNRLWGCSSDEQTIYASALGDPTNFNVFDGLSTDSYAVAVATEGPFTGCGRLGSVVCFWKEKGLHKILGDYPAEYVMYTDQLEGVREGSWRSMCVINSTLYYLGIHGPHAYSGGLPQPIFRGMGNRTLTGGVGGTDGKRYYLCCQDDGWFWLMIYDPASGAWLREDSADYRAMARPQGDLLLLTSGGSIFREDAGGEDPDVLWSMTFTPFRETLEGRKRYSRLLFRLELPIDAWAEAWVRTDGGKWERTGRVIGKDDDTVQMWVRPNRCDSFEVKLEGKGPCAVKGILREYQIQGPK